MSLPNQMFTNELNGLKGFYPGQPWVVDKAVDVDTAVATYGTNLKAGRVAHIDATTKKLQAGTTTIAANSTSVPMPLFIYQNVSDFDVVGDDGNFVGTSAGATTPRLSGIVATMAAELETTEFISATYAPGDLLVSDNSTAGSIGKLTKYTASSAGIIVGVVSEASTGLTSPHSRNIPVLRFHTCFVPKFA